MDFSRLFRNIPVVTKNLIIINVLIWLLMELLGVRADYLITRYGALHYFGSSLFNPAQLFTYMFLHSGFTHLFFNMFALFMFGITLERVFGSKRFLFYFISCGLGAALIQECVYAWQVHDVLKMLPEDAFEYVKEHGTAPGVYFTDPTVQRLNMLMNVPTVGASGAVYGILLAFGMLFPNSPIYLMFIPVPIKAKYFVIGYGLIEFYQGFIGRPGDNVAHFAHLGGMLIGLAIILYWKKKGIFYDRFY